LLKIHENHISMFPGLWMIKQQQSWSGELGLCGVGDTSRYFDFFAVYRREVDAVCNMTYAPVD
jgi:hypothetical protein